MSEIERWIRANLPLEERTLLHAVQEAQQRARRLAMDEATMARRLSEDDDMRAELLELVVPPESWLFRHAAAFEAVREWLREHPARMVRMASLGCARGAEALSLAAAAASLGRTRADTSIVAIDWNSRHLRAAAEGHASPLAQRGPIPPWAQPSLQADARGWLRLRDEPLSMIEWRRGDLLVDALPGTFDVIFCRNVAIYLDGRARARLAERLRRIAGDDALLCLGHADPAVLWQDAFEALPISGAFAFRRAAGARPATTTVPADGGRCAAGARKPTLPGPRPIASNEPIVPARRAAPELDPHADALARAQHHADVGRLVEAEAQLQSLLAHDPVHADAWALLGAVRLSQARAEEAEECLRKVVYLRPRDALALLQWSALAEARGDTATADRLRMRAARPAAGDDA